jgi:hypothetical protein
MALSRRNRYCVKKKGQQGGNRDADPPEKSIPGKPAGERRKPTLEMLRFD